MANYNSSHTGAEIDSAIGRVKDTAVTAGTVSASLGVVVDANKDISGFRNVTLTGQLQAATINLTGDTTIGDGDTDNITINADVNSNIIPNTDNTFDLGSASKQWKDLYVNGIGYIDQLGTDADPIAIYASSGEIDGTAIGSESASTGAFTTISASGTATFNGTVDINNTSDFGSNAMTNVNIDSGAIDGTPIGGNSANTGAFTTISASGNVDFNADLDVDGVTNLDVVDIDGAVDMASTLAVADAITQGSGVLTIKNATGDGNGLRIFQDSSDASKIYNHYNGTLQLGVGNTTALTIDSSENTTFAGTITVGASNGSEEVKANRIRVRHIDGLADASDYSQGDLFINHISSGNIICSSNVGIGTTNPASLLHLYGGSGGGGTLDTLTVQHENTTSTGDGPNISFEGRYNSNAWQFGRIKTYNNGSNFGANMDFDIHPGDGTQGSNVATAMTIQAGGNVGIGTTSPQTTLHVGTGNEAPDIDAVALISNAGTTNLAIRNSSNNVELLNYVDSSQGIIGTVTSHPLRIRTANSDRVTITSGGNVGIGTTTPGYQLDLRRNDTGTTTSLGIRQLGTGDASMAFQTTTSPYGFCIGVDGSDSDAFKIATGTDDVGTNTKLTITSAGEMMVNRTASPTSMLNINTANGRYGLMVDDTFGNNALCLFMDNGSGIGSITIVSGATAYNTSSDYRLKENQVTLANGLIRLNQLKPYNFNFIAHPDIVQDGFFAHEVAEVVPTAVSGEKDAVDDDGEIESQQLDHSKLVPLLVKALQEADDKIDALTARIEALEA